MNKKFDIYILYFIVFFHFFVVFANLLSFLVLPFVVPFYLSVPVMSFIVFISFTRDYCCPLTSLENYYRRKNEMPEIKAFISHYLVKPIKLQFKNSK